MGVQAMLGLLQAQGGAARGGILVAQQQNVNRHKIANFYFLFKKVGCGKIADIMSFLMVPHMLGWVAIFMHFCSFKLTILLYVTPGRKELSRKAQLDNHEFVQCTTHY